MLTNVDKNEEKRVNVFYCKFCDYTSRSKWNYERHQMTLKHKMLTNVDKNEEPKNDLKFRCNICDYVTSTKWNLDRHKTTLTHKNREKRRKTRKNEEDLFQCHCGKQFSSRQTLSFHKKKCKQQQNIITNNNINFNINNLNIQVLLDEKCKDAMTIQNFMMQLQMTMEDISNRRLDGLSGISNILIKNLGTMPIKERPIHCIKNCKWLINDASEGWKEDNGSLVIKQAECGIHKRFQEIWDKKYPNWVYSESLQKNWIECIKILNQETSVKDIGAVLKKLSLVCKLSNDEIQHLTVL